MWYNMKWYNVICNITIEHHTLRNMIHTNLTKTHKRHLQKGNKKKTPPNLHPNLCTTALPCHILAKDKASTPRRNHLRGGKKNIAIPWGIPKNTPLKNWTGFVARGRKMGKTWNNRGVFFRRIPFPWNPAEIWIFLRSSRWFNTVTQLPRFLLLVQYVYTSPSIYIYIHTNILLDQSCGFVFLLSGSFVGAV